jgi:phenylacetate-CoA ligase
MKKLYYKIYIFSPVWFQNIIISVYGYIIFKQRYGKVYRKTFNELINKDYSDYSKELEGQTNTLKKFLKYAIDNSQFYKELYKNIDITTINSIEDLKLLPIVDKEKIRQNIEQVYTIDEKEGIVSFTGGTTGKALKIIYEKNDFQKRMAYLDAFKYRLGIDPFKSKKATFSGRELTVNPKSKVFWRYNFIYKQRLYSTFDLTDANMDLYVNDLNKFKPVVMNGFVSALYELAVFIDRNKCELKFKPKAIFTTSETLLIFHRELIERVFNSKIYNQYASAEGAPFITECKKGNLHYNLDTGVIETKGEDDNQMIITSFTTHGTPLIRYNIGDLITFKTGNCSCGSSHPLVEKIEGRKVDFLFSKTKGKISLSHLADVIKGNPNSVKKMQFVQDDIDTLQVNIVIDEKLYSKDHEALILKEMKYRFGEEAKIKVNIVDDIPREKSGKFSIIKNNIKT